jgi:hypothetical protein
MSVLTPEVVDILMNLSCPLEEKTALMKALVRAAQAFQPPAQSVGINEETERRRNASTYAERKRAKDRERQRQLREQAKQSRDVAVGSRDVAGDPPATEGDKPATTGDAAPSHVGARVVNPSLPSLRSEEVGGGGVERERVPTTDDWPKGSGQHLGKLLVEAADSQWLDPSRSPDLITTLGRLTAWKRDGASWEHDVVPVVTGLCANRRSRVASWKFFDQAIARSIADNRAALEIPEAGRVRATGPPSFTDQIAATNTEARRIAFEMLDRKNG